MKNLYLTINLILGLSLISKIAPAQITTQTLNFTGALQTFTVPNCVSQITISCYGGAGFQGSTSLFSAPGGTAGLGGLATGVYTVSPTTVLNIYVGGVATGSLGGFNGGGNGANGNPGGGGGASDVRFGGFTLGNRVIVAGGGGGGGNGGCSTSGVAGGAGGAGGGGNGVSGITSTGGGPGGGGMAATGGSPGIGCICCLGVVGANGVSGIGGNGGTGAGGCCCTATVGGGGGGGGFTGGGGGGGGSAGTTGCATNEQGGGGGGAGGTNYFSPAFTNTSVTNGVQAGNGKVVLSYIPAGVVSLTLTASSNSVCQGSAVTLTASGASNYTWSTGSNSNIISPIPSVTTNYTLTGTITNSLGTCSATSAINITVTPSPTITVNSGTICAGASFTMVPTGAITYTFSGGSAIVSPTANATYTVTGSNGAGCTGNAVSNVTVIVCVGGQAFNFDGVNDYANVGMALGNSISSINKITVEAWVQPNTNTGGGSIIGDYSTPVNECQYFLRRDYAGGYFFQVGNSAPGTYTSVVSAASTTIGVWQHIAGTYDGATLRIYVNGVLSGTAAASIGTFGTPSNPTWIGGNNAGTGEFFNGNIDEIRVWNRALCQGEIVNNMVGEIPTNAIGLIANYHFNQGVAGQNNLGVTTVIDATSNAYTGTLTNVALTTGTLSNWVSPGAVTGNAPAFVSPTVAVTGNNAICLGSSSTLTANGNVTTYNWVAGPTTATNVVTPTVTVTYSVSGTNLGCPSNLAVFTVTVNSLPTINATTNNSLICSLPIQQTATLIATGANTYTWSTGANGSSIAVSPSVTTTYTVTGTNVNGCQNTSIITQSASNCAGINNLNSNHSISVYPNPNSGEFIVELANGLEKNIEVTDLNGKVVYRQNSLNDKINVSLKHLPNAVYFVKIQSNNTSETIKIIKQ